MSNQGTSTATTGAIVSNPPQNHRDYGSTNSVDDKQALQAAAAPITQLAAKETQRTESALGDALLRFLRIRKGPKPEEYDLDAVSPVEE